MGEVRIVGPSLVSTTCTLKCLGLYELELANIRKYPGFFLEKDPNFEA